MRKATRRAHSRKTRTASLAPRRSSGCPGARTPASRFQSGRAVSAARVFVLMYTASEVVVRHHMCDDLVATDDTQAASRFREMRFATLPLASLAPRRSSGCPGARTPASRFQSGRAVSAARVFVLMYTASEVVVRHHMCDDLVATDDTQAASRFREMRFATLPRALRARRMQRCVCMMDASVHECMIHA